MITHKHYSNRPGLLVSVRSAPEAVAAIAGGANVIDVKEPARGPLGAADFLTIAAVVQAVNGRATVTAALGELVDLLRDNIASDYQKLPDDVALVKLGLAGCGEIAEWPLQWRAAMERMIHHDTAQPPRPVAVVYADWRTAAAPNPLQVLAAAIEITSPALLVDTCDKSNGTLFDHWPVNELGAFVHEVRSRGIAVVLAGSLADDAISVAATLRPNLIAVRTAACEGGRNGTVSSQLVHEIQQLISDAVAEKMPARM